jgi:exonuclease III
MIAHIEIPDEETGFIIANTHFQAGGQDEIRYNQSLELVAALDNFVSSLGGSLSTSQLPIFAAGDFNTKELGDDGITRAIDYLQLVDTLEAKDLFREVNGGNATAFTTFGGRRLDYVFGLSVDYELIDAGIDDFVNKSEIRLSDHLGSYAVVDIPPGLNNKGTDFGRNSGGIDWKLSLSLFLSTMTLMHLGEVL